MKYKIIYITKKTNKALKILLIFLPEKTHIIKHGKDAIFLSKTEVTYKKLFKYKFILKKLHFTPIPAHINCRCSVTN